MRGVWGVVTGLALGTAAARVSAQALDSGSALGGLREARAACEADDGVLWGRNLCGPISYIAGPPSMVGELRRMLVDAKVDEDDIRTEEFRGY